MDEVLLGAASSLGDFITPFLGTLAAALTAAVAWATFRWQRGDKERDRREAKDRADRERNLRIDATCDAVLGKASNPALGRNAEEPGLVHRLPLNGYRFAGVSTITDEITEARQAANRAEDASARVAQTLGRVAEGQRLLSAEVAHHGRLDEERARALNDALELLGAGRPVQEAG